MTKIGVDAKRYFFNQTGLGNYSRTLMNSLGQYFPENEYILYSPKKPSFLPQIPKYEIITPKGWTKNVPAFWRSFLLGKQAEKDNLQVYHGLSQELPFDIAHTKALKIVTVHDLLYLRYPQAYSFFDQKMHITKLEFACKHADIIIAISEQTKKDILAHCKVQEAKIKVIYQPANDIFQQATFSHEEKKNKLEKYKLYFPFVLYVGAITYRKNVISLIKSFPFLPKDLHIVLVGKGDKMAEIQEFATKNGFANRLHILSNIPTEDLPFLYQSAAAFVYPSLFEGFGLPILEAQHSGTPVVVGENGCFPETAGKGAIYVNQQAPAEIADAIRKLIEDTTFRQEMIAKGIDNALSFSAEKQAKQVLRLYGNL